MLLGGQAMDELRRNMNIVEIASTLQKASTEEVSVTIPEGWRYGQIVDYLTELAVLTDGAEYARRVASGDITGLDPARYSFLQSRPAGTSLEGYLFPDTYEFASGTDVIEFLSKNNVFELNLERIAFRMVKKSVQDCAGGRHIADQLSPIF